MRKILRLLTVGVFACCSLACSDDPIDSAVQPANRLYLPRDNYSVDLAKGLPVKFEWAASKSADNGYIVYELLFDTEEGNFENPLYVLSSDNNGASSYAEIASTTLNTIALLAGADYGETAHVKWSVRAWKDRSSVRYADAQYLSITRLDVMPLEVGISGEAVEGGSLMLGAALPIATQKGKHIAETEPAAFEGFVKLTPGKLKISDDMGYYYRMDANSALTRLTEEDGEELDSRIEEEGVYWLYLKFSTKVYSLKKIERVAVWTNPWWGGHMGLEPLTYAGNGVWEVKDYAWDIADGGFDSRYHFNVTYADGSEERWGYWDDDCRNNANPDGDAKFFNIYRFASASMNDDWAHSWKTRENIKEGANMLVSFRVCMNRSEKEQYFHERAFSPRSDVTGTSVDLSGSAMENGEKRTLNAALPVISADGRYDRTERVADTYECFTQLSAGELIVQDDMGHYFTLADGALKSSDTEVKNAVSQPGIYWISIDLKAKSYVMKQIEKVELWNRPWFGSTALKEMNYDGNGVWSVENYAWKISDGDRFDSRYYFVATYADGTKERWAFWDDDCRNNANPDGDAKFFNVYRFDDANWTDAWKHAYKTRENIKEGANSLATFRLHMNNTDKADYYHERQFKGIDEVLPTAITLSGVTENGAGVAMFGARKIGEAKNDVSADELPNAFECFTRLTAGELTVTDDLGRNWQLVDGGALTLGSQKAAVEAGIYWIKLDFENKSWTMKKIEKVVLCNKTWFMGTAEKEIAYEGNGVWGIADYAWPVNNDSNFDSRHYFITTYADGSKERWSHWEDDCRGSSNPDADPRFFTVYRLQHDKIGEWDHAWKTRENIGEGRNQLATLRVRMNRSDNAEFRLERSFKDK